MADASQEVAVALRHGQGIEFLLETETLVFDLNLNKLKLMYAQ